MLVSPLLWAKIPTWNPRKIAQRFIEPLTKKGGRSCRCHLDDPLWPMSQLPQRQRKYLLDKYGIFYDGHIAGWNLRV
jgi:hypothetical protein